LPAATCAAVEDSSNGIRAAAAAGMTVIAIPNSVYPPRSDVLALCAKIAPSPDEVRHFLVERLPEPKFIAEPTPDGSGSATVRSGGR
jgi:beta-phosphoglucomutase-like phosphatase (HAD superfamily)